MYKDLISILASALNENKIAKLSDDPDWDHIISTAKRHNVLSALYTGISKLPDSKKPDERTLFSLQQNYYNETRRSIIQLYEAERIQEAFEDNGIYSLVMKGCNTKLRYPTQTMRSMGDIDFLIKASQNKAVYDTMQSLGYNDFEEGRKHDHYRGSSVVEIEMHRELVTTEMDFYSYYSDIWNRLTPKNDKRYIGKMTIEDEYIYNIVHLIQHFKLGGIGIRFM